MGKIEKLIQEALESPQNLKFSELKKLCEHFGLELRNVKGSHHQYKRAQQPKFTISIQDAKGKAKPYQVRQLMESARRFGLLED